MSCTDEVLGKDSVDRVRELREQDAWLAGLSDSVPAVGAAGTTRFGDRVPGGTAASFRCGECGEIAGIVRVARAGGTAGSEPPPRGEPGAGDWLVLNHFLGTVWHEDTGRCPGRSSGADRAGECRSGHHTRDQLDAVGHHGFLLPGMPAELLQPRLGHALRGQRGEPRLHHRHLPERAPAPARVTSLRIAERRPQSAFTGVVVRVCRIRPLNRLPGKLRPNPAHDGRWKVDDARTGPCSAPSGRLAAPGRRDEREPRSDLAPPSCPATLAQCDGTCGPLPASRLRLRRHPSARQRCHDLPGRDGECPRTGHLEGGPATAGEDQTGKRDLLRH
jgi:hypothetical protein